MGQLKQERFLKQTNHLTILVLAQTKVKENENINYANFDGRILSRLLICSPYQESRDAQTKNYVIFMKTYSRSLKTSAVLRLIQLNTRAVTS